MPLLARCDLCKPRIDDAPQLADVTFEGLRLCLACLAEVLANQSGYDIPPLLTEPQFPIQQSIPEEDRS